MLFDQVSSLVGTKESGPDLALNQVPYFAILSYLAVDPEEAVAVERCDPSYPKVLLATHQSASEFHSLEHQQTRLYAL